MKKVISLILCLGMLVGFQMPSFADEGSNVSELLDFMHAIGVMQEYDATTFKSNQKVTRAVFVQGVSSLIGEGVEEEGTVYYHDVSRDYWAFNCISRLTKLGIISGNEEQCFNPERLITRAEAARIMLTVLGYNDVMMTGEVYPHGYLRFAGEVKLFEKCSYGDEITMEDMLNIFRNSLEADTVSVQIKSDGTTYTKSGVTMLERYYDMHFGRGTMTGCDRVNLSTGERIDDDKVFIDDVAYETELTGLMEYLGRRVEFIYYTDDYDDNKLVWVKSTGKNDVLKLGINVYKEFNADDYVLTYEEDESGKTKRARLEKGIDVVYNGAYVKDGVKDILSKEKYSVSLVSNGGAYDLAVVEAYDNYVVADIDLTNFTIYDKVTSSKKISLDKNDWDAVEITRSGAEIPFSDINAGDVVSIFRAYDGKSVKAVVSSNVIDGVVENVRFKDEMPYVVMKDKEYEFFDATAIKDMNPGDAVKLRIDFNGYIADAVIDGGGEMMAYVVKAYVDLDAIDQALKLKLLTKDGIEVYTCHSKLKVNDMPANDTIIANEFIGASGQTVQRLVMVKFDSEQKIRKIYTSDSVFALYLGNETGRYKTNIGRLGKKILIDDDTQIFSVPSVYSSEDKDFSMRRKSNLVNDQNYTFDVYRYKTDELDFEDVLVLKDANWAQASEWDASILVERIMETYDADTDEVVECLVGYQGSSEVTFYTNGEYSFKQNDIKSGDLIRVARDEKGKVESASVSYSYQGTSRPIGSDENAGYRIATVYANDKIGKVLKAGYESGAAFDEIFNLNGVSILVYEPDSRGAKIRVGTMGDIRTYKSSGNDCSTVVIQTHYSEPRTVIVYSE